MLLVIKQHEFHLFKQRSQFFWEALRKLFIFNFENYFKNNFDFLDYVPLSLGHVSFGF